MPYEDISCSYLFEIGIFLIHILLFCVGAEKINIVVCAVIE